LNGKIDINLTRRISLGGYHSHDLLTKSLCLKYPQHRHHFAEDPVNEIQHKYTEVVLDYNEQLKFMNIGHKKQRRLEVIADLNK